MLECAILEFLRCPASSAVKRELSAVLGGPWISNRVSGCETKRGHGKGVTS